MPDSVVRVANARAGKWVLRGASVVVVATLVVVGLYSWGLTRPAVRPVVDSDVLGPVADEPAEHYLARAAVTMNVSGSGDQRRWALVSLSRYLSDGDTLMLAASAPAVLLSQVAIHVPVRGVRTPVEMVPAASGAGGLATARRLAAAKVIYRAATLDNSHTRAKDIARLYALRTERGCACVAALVLYAPVASLLEVRERPDVRAVELLPGDAAGGRFAVHVLVPGRKYTADQTPDSGAVPVS